MSDGSTQRVFFICVVVKTGLAGVKLVVGFLAGSQALVADGVHSVSDTFTNTGAWISHRLAQSPPDEDHHYGHGNFESLAALLIGLLLFAGGAGIVASAVIQDRQASADYLGVAAVAVSVLSIVANLWLSHITRRAAALVHSPTLVALDRDHRSDALSSVLVIIGVGASLFGVPWVERVLAGGIGCMVMVLGLKSAREGFDVLMDRADPRVREEIERTASGVPGVLAVQSVRVHPLGSRLRADLEVSVPGDLTVREGHAIAHAVVGEVRRTHARVGDVHVHINPHEETAEEGTA